MSVRISRGWPGLRSGYDQTNPRPATRKSKPSLSISSTPGRASARRRTSSASAIGIPPRSRHPRTLQDRRHGPIRLVRELFGQEADREVHAQSGDLVASQVVHDGVRDPDGPAGRLDAGELAGMGADEIRFDRRLAFVHQQVLELRIRVERAAVQVPDELRDGLPALGPLPGSLHGGDNVIGEVVRVVAGALEQRVEVSLHHMPLWTHKALLASISGLGFMLGGADESLAGNARDATRITAPRRGPRGEARQAPPFQRRISIAPALPG